MSGGDHQWAGPGAMYGNPQYRFGMMDPYGMSGGRGGRGPQGPPPQMSSAAARRQHQRNTEFYNENYDTMGAFIGGYTGNTGYGGYYGVRGGYRGGYQRYGAAHAQPPVIRPIQTYYYTSGSATPSAEQPATVSVPQQQAPKSVQSRGNGRRTFKSHQTQNDRSQPRQQKPPQSGPTVLRRIQTAPEISTDSNMTERLISQLTMETYECMVCCDSVRVRQAIWSCSSCYHAFHLKCIQEWGRTSLNSSEDNREGSQVSTWRCPACQKELNDIPREYFCFCGKISKPEYTPGETPHTCGDMCGKKYRTAECVHPCTLLCHPGPCPPCAAMVTKSCNCGKQSKSIRCDKSAVIQCESVCEKTLACQVHKCEKVCHAGDCPKCEKTVDVSCFCGKETSTLDCAVASVAYSCGKACLKDLSCGNHNCHEPCHQGECKPCVSAPDIVKTCPCGKQKLPTKRTSCLDEIPTCGQTCNRILHCGPDDEHHRCQWPCHTGQCPPCEGDTKKRCRCGANLVTQKCSELSVEGEVLCNRVCKKKLHCNKHQCRKLCCKEDGHVCTQTCNKLLTCGKHYCLENCHRGNCERCWEASFEELPCHCGNTRLQPPIACGTEPPVCDFPCARVHPCGHPPRHTCHQDERCPQCVELIQSRCNGGHQLMNAVPCFMGSISCGRVCGKGLPYCNHLCMQTCHSGACLDESQQCKQRCQERRSDCNHACDQPCHFGNPCPPKPCLKPVPVTCECGRIKQQMPCNEFRKACESQRMAMLSAKMNEAKINGESLNMSQLHSQCDIPYSLPCHDNCRRETWLKRLDDAFGPLENNPLLQYSDYLIQQTKTGYAEFVYELEKIFVSMVETCVKSGMKQQHAFKPMNSIKRRIVHELAEFYGLETQSFDEEPHKHIVVYAYRHKVKLPPVSLTAMTQTKKRPATGQHSQQQEEALAFQQSQYEAAVAAMQAGQSSDIFNLLPLQLPRPPYEPGFVKLESSSSSLGQQGSASTNPLNDGSLESFVPRQPPPGTIDYFDF